MNHQSIFNDQFVVSQSLNKMCTSPEHEFLVIKTMDKKDVKRYFILECTVGSPELLDNMAGVAGHGQRSLL